MKYLHGKSSTTKLKQWNTNVQPLKSIVPFSSQCKRCVDRYRGNSEVCKALSRAREVLIPSTIPSTA